MEPSEASSVDEIPLIGFQPQVKELILDLPAPGKHAARHAVTHLERAWRLRALDPEMAAFRAITAEEEAARALIHALKRHRYPGSELLNWRKHEHKAAIAPFFEVINRFLGSLKGLPKMKLVIDHSANPKRLEVGLSFPGIPGLMMPQPPLNYHVRRNEQLYDFASKITEFAESVGASTIQKHIEARANQRNRLLYAASDGIPNIESPIESVILAFRDTTFRILSVYVMLDPYAEHQEFVLQMLRAFLPMVPRLKVPAELT